MTTSLQSLIASGTKLWLDSIDPELIASNRALGATGATSNPIIIANLIKSGRWDADILTLAKKGLQAEDITWALTDQLVHSAELVFQEVYEQSAGNDGYVSFEVDPLIEATDAAYNHQQKVDMYVSLAKKWSHGHRNRMIKIPATNAGIAALPMVAAEGIPINITLLFSQGQYQAARDAVVEGISKQSTKAQATFKSVYSVFVSRLDVYSSQHVPQLATAQGWLGIINAKRIWSDNQSYWRQKPMALQQEVIFASTGTKKPEDPPWKYLDALAGSDIQTNPPETNEAVQRLKHVFSKSLPKPAPDEVVALIDKYVDQDHMERTLMTEGLAKFADPQKDLIKLVATKIG